MKAIGMQNKDVMLIFLLNSALIGLIGGIGGAVLGIISSASINSFAGVSSQASRGGMMGGGLTSMMSSSTISYPLLIAAILFAVLIGMLSGAIPAYRASRLNPVDALRYE